MHPDHPLSTDLFVCVLECLTPAFLLHTGLCVNRYWNSCIREQDSLWCDRSEEFRNAAHLAHFTAAPYRYVHQQQWRLRHCTMLEWRFPRQGCTMECLPSALFRVLNAVQHIRVDYAPAFCVDPVLQLPHLVSLYVFQPQGRLTSAHAHKPVDFTWRHQLRELTVLDRRTGEFPAPTWILETCTRTALDRLTLSSGDIDVPLTLKLANVHTATLDHYFQCRTVDDVADLMLMMRVWSLLPNLTTLHMHFTSPAGVRPLLMHSLYEPIYGIIFQDLRITTLHISSAYVFHWHEAITNQLQHLLRCVACCPLLQDFELQSTSSTLLDITNEHLEALAPLGPRLRRLRFTDRLSATPGSCLYPNFEPDAVDRMRVLFPHLTHLYVSFHAAMDVASLVASLSQWPAHQLDHCEIECAEVDNEVAISTEVVWHELQRQQLDRPSHALICRPAIVNVKRPQQIQTALLGWTRADEQHPVCTREHACRRIDMWREVLYASNA